MLACGLLLVALPGAGEAPSACPAPATARFSQGRSVGVRCDRPQGAPLRGPARLLFGQRLDPNAEDAVSLAVLPGIGAARAEAMVRARAAKPFAAPADLERVPGIGPKTRARLEPWLSFDPHPHEPGG